MDRRNARRRDNHETRARLRGADIEPVAGPAEQPIEEETGMAAFRGSCLCSEVAFEVEGPFDHFLNRHCSCCRKATGTAHSCEAVVKAPTLGWLRGKASVVRFDLPQARSFAAAFCGKCGSPMPHFTRSGLEAIVPAGRFDEPLEAAPDRHAHWASRADW
jgi:hypothetical protein